MLTAYVKDTSFFLLFDRLDNQPRAAGLIRTEATKLTLLWLSGADDSTAPNIALIMSSILFQAIE
jgi:hypothetical protein